MNDLITTAEAARIAGVGVSSIKRWADQDLIHVIKTPGGHRRVIKANLLRFLQGAGAATKRPEPQDSFGIRSAWKADEISELSPTALGSFWADEFLKGDEYEIQAALLDARSRLGSWYHASDEASLGLREIGLRWKRGEVSVLDEHVASEHLTRALATITRAMPSSPEDPVCVLACVDHESHTIGLSFLQVCIREAGWRPLWVGANTPVEYLQNIVLSKDIGMVAVSASQATSDPNKLLSFSAQLGASCLASGSHLVLGGSGPWPDAPEFGYRLHSFTELSSFLGGL